MDRRSKISVALLVVVLLAVAGGLWRRQHSASVPGAVAQAQYHVLTSGVVEAAAEHRAVLNEAMQVPKEVESAQAQSRASRENAVGALSAERPPIVNPEPVVQANPEPTQPPPDLTEVPPSQQVLIGFSGGVIGETDPCG
jgi:hypothetical protein